MLDIPSSSPPHVAENVKNSTMKQWILNVLSTPQKLQPQCQIQGNVKSKCNSQNQISKGQIRAPHIYFSVRDDSLNRKTITNVFLVDIPSSSLPHVAKNVRNSTMKPAMDLGYFVNSYEGYSHNVISREQSNKNYKPKQNK